MQQPDLIILESDRKYAVQRIALLQDKIQKLGPEFYDVFNQSSETWHDNAPFEAVRDRQSVLYAELQSLKNVLHRALPSVPRQDKKAAGVGCVVEVLDQKSGKTTNYFIAGDWTPYAGEKMSSLDAVIISRRAPIGSSLLGLKVNEEFEFRNKLYLIKNLSYEYSYTGHNKKDSTLK